MRTRDGLAEQGLIIPVSASMVNNLKDYDTVLENYSIPLMQRIRFHLDKTGTLVVDNAEDLGAYFRYPDLTAQSIYLAGTLQAAIK